MRIGITREEELAYAREAFDLCVLIMRDRHLEASLRLEAVKELHNWIGDDVSNRFLNIGKP